MIFLRKKSLRQEVHSVHRLTIQRTVLVIISNVSKVGLIASITGLVLGLLDLYDRQSSGAAVMIVLNLIFMYILPMILFLSTMTIATKEVGVANIISNVNII